MRRPPTPRTRSCGSTTEAVVGAHAAGAGGVMDGDRGLADMLVDLVVALALRAGEELGRDEGLPSTAARRGRGRRGSRRAATASRARRREEVLVDQRGRQRIGRGQRDVAAALRLHGDDAGGEAVGERRLERRRNRARPPSGAAVNRSCTSGSGRVSSLFRKATTPPGTSPEKPVAGQIGLGEVEPDPVGAHHAEERARRLAPVHQDDRDVVLQVLADRRAVRRRVSMPCAASSAGIADPRQHQELRRVDDAARRAPPRGARRPVRRRRRWR